MALPRPLGHRLDTGLVGLDHPVVWLLRTPVLKRITWLFWQIVRTHGPRDRIPIDRAACLL